VTEDAPMRPTTPYAVSKAACDMSLQTYFLQYGFPVSFTRAANVYGPGQQLYRIIPRAVMTILKRGRLPLHGGGHALRSFIYVEDAMDATLSVMTRGRPGRIYHIATDRMISIAGLVRLICNKMGVDFDAHVEHAEERAGKDMAYSLDSSRIRAELDWCDAVDLETGIDRTIEWARQNFELLSRLPMNYEHKP
jgi:dTDP-glucose 4,6-dehydratase